MEELEMIIFKIISAAGEAKSCYMEAITAAREGDFETAVSLLKKGDEVYKEGHEVHFDLVQKEASGNGVTPGLLLIHAEDQMMSAELTRAMADEFILLYKERG